MTSHQIQFGSQDIDFELQLMKRNTLSISVHPDLSVIVRAPENTKLEDIEKKVYHRAKWILNQQRRFEIYLPDVPPRKYVSGESHRFLGRQYRLKIIKSKTEQIKLSRQFLEVHTLDITSSNARVLVETWYREQANQIFQERLSACYTKLAREKIPYPKISIRRMQSSWGSCSAKSMITLNIKLIQVPMEYIDYVITHELCHLKHLHHEAQYYKLLSRVMPGWQVKKDKLDRFDFG
jgi:predicted metal-dependent hydrolase